MRPHAAHRFATVTAISAMLGISASLATRLNASVSPEGERLIERVVMQTTRSGLSIRATRQLRAGTVSGKHQGWMTVETSLSPARGLEWNVVDEGGSGRTREKVLLELLKNEAEAWRSGTHDAAAISPENYTLTPLAGSDDGQIRIRVQPRRADPRLIDGVLVVSADGYPVRLEGKLAKAPSFWVKSVTVVKRYARFDGLALPVSIESLADVRMVGRSTFTMRYQYSHVNGRQVSHAVANQPFVGPTAEILALHSSGSE